MPMKLNLSISFHALCIVIVLSLGSFIVIQLSDNCNTALQKELQFSFKSARENIKKEDQKSYKFIKKQAIEYENPNNLKYEQAAHTAISMTNSIIKLLDSLQQKPTSQFVADVQGNMSLHRSQLWELIDYDPYFSTSLPLLNSQDWLYQSWENDSREQFNALLERAKLNVVFIENFVLGYCSIKVRGSGDYFDRFSPWISFTQIAPQVGDTVTADVSLRDNREAYCIIQPIFRLNGEQLTTKQGVASFELRFEKPGTYPLHLSVEAKRWEADTLVFGEKTYFLKVLK